MRSLLASKDQMKPQRTSETSELRKFTESGQYGVSVTALNGFDGTPSIRSFT